MSAPMTRSSRLALVLATNRQFSLSLPARCSALRSSKSLGDRRSNGSADRAAVELKIANGYHGWSEHAPFDKVIVTAAPDLIPPPLIQQLKSGGKLVIPAGLPDAQTLILVEKPSNGGVTIKEILPVRFSQLEDAEAA
jgi:protein-L-isoaspartate O-methyltransferase